MITKVSIQVLSDIELAQSMQEGSENDKETVFLNIML